MLPKHIAAVLELAGVRRAYLTDGRIISRERLAELIAELADWERTGESDKYCPGCGHPAHKDDCLNKGCECIEMRVGRFRKF